MKRIIVCVILVSISIISGCLPGIGGNNIKEGDSGFDNSKYEQIAESIPGYGYAFLHTNNKKGNWIEV